MNKINIRDIIAALDKLVRNPRAGLPDEVFFYISKTTPFFQWFINDIVLYATL